MKTLTLFLILSGFSFGQQTIYDTITHDGLERAFILYVPANYTAGNPVPLVLNFHGYTSNSQEQMFYGDFRPIADTAGFILVHPMGTLDESNEPYWNSGWGGTVDDIGFAAALIDSISASYSINQSRVFSTGMSNGGFMSYTLACSLSNRIAAIASVTGTMNVNQSLTCNAQHPMPVMEIHGTLDPTVPYNGNTWAASIPNVLNYWANFNQCTIPPQFTAVPNISTTDGCTAEHYLYSTGINGVDVEHYKIIGGAHTWPGAPIATGVTNYDISASKKIWQFFLKYDLNGKIAFNSIDELSKVDLIISPNPGSILIEIIGIDENSKNGKINIYSSSGQLVKIIDSYFDTIDISDLEKGIYFLTVFSNSSSSTLRFVKE